VATVDLGESIWLPYQSTGSNGNLIVPTGAVTATITQPDGTLATPAVTNTAVGHYETVFVTAQPGRHTLRWTALGANPSVDVFDVLETYPPYIVSLDDAKTLLQFADDVDADEELRKYSAAATGIIERYMRQAVVRRAVSETHYRCCTSRLALRKRPVISLTSVVGINGTPTWDVSQLYVDTTPGIVSSLTGPGWFRGDLIAGYVAGYTVIPGNVQEAARIVIQHLWATRRGLGGNLITQQLPGFNIGYALPQSVKDLLGPPPPLVA
jgi:hypothetical protein